MIDVIMLTKNESLNLPFSLPSVTPWAKNVFVVDSESTDGTQQLAESLGAKVVTRPWLGYAAQKNWALDTLPLEAPWTLILDADEVILPELRDEMLAIAKRDPADVPEAGYHLNRYFIFLGKRIRHCGYYPSWNLRFFKHGTARYEDRAVHEHMNVDGPTGFLKGHMEHYDRRGLEDYIAKHNRYSTLEAQALLEEQTCSLPARFFGGPLERRRWLKTRLYPKLPAKWFFRFGYSYVLKLGFLDGLTGLRFCLFLASYDLFIQLKLAELKQHVEPAPETVVRHTTTTPNPSAPQARPS